MKHPYFDTSIALSGADLDVTAIKVFQIGFNKTGSTFMEREFFPNLLNMEILEGGYHRAINHAIDYICYAREGEFDIEMARKLLAHGLATHFGHVPPVFMHEALTFRYYNQFDQKRTVERLAQVFPSTVFVLGSRERVAWLTSHWGQYMRVGGLLPIDEFALRLVERKNSDLQMCYFGELSEWCIQHFGKERFILYDMKELRDPEPLVEVFRKLVEVPDRAADADVDSKPPVVNKAEDFATFELVRFLNRFVPHDCGASYYARIESDPLPEQKRALLWHRFRYLFKYGKMKVARNLRKILFFAAESQPPRLSEEVARRVEEMFREDEALRKTNLATAIHLSRTVESGGSAS